MLRPLTPINLVDIREDPYLKDKERIVEALAMNGYLCTMEQAEAMWQKYSDTYAAGWLSLPSTPIEIYLSVRPYFHPAPVEQKVIASHHPACDPGVGPATYRCHPLCNVLAADPAGRNRL